MSLYLGNTPIANTGYNKANTNLSNLTLQGKNIANWSNNVTNCITEIPQDIKLEVSSGVATLKSGSKVYVPNGANTFNMTTVDSDYSSSDLSSSTEPYVLFYNTSGNLALSKLSVCFSGTSEPSSPVDGTIWYDTTNNIVKRYNGSSWASGLSLPVGILSTGATSVQVFNGYGYIGSTVFVLTGVKGLIPNGRNEDLSLKSISFDISSVITSTLSYGEGEYYLGYIDGGYIGFLRETITHYLKDENLILDDITGIKHNDWMFFGSFYANSSNKITSFTPKTAFHALDYNDSSTISGWSMPSSRYIDLTLGASGSSYIAPANGYFFFSKQATAANQEVYIAIAEPANEIYAWESIVPVSGQYAQITVPVKKGYKYKVLYALGGTTVAFRFIYAEGEE